MNTESRVDPAIERDLKINHTQKHHHCHTGIYGKEYKDMIDEFIVIGAMVTTGGDAEEAARLLGVTVDFINEGF